MKLDKKEILRRRAKQISRIRTVKDEQYKTIEILDFVLNDEQYAFETMFVKEVYTTNEIIKVPASPDFLYGVFNYRGLILPIIDLKVLFGISSRKSYERYKLVVLVKDNSYTSTIVDSIGSVSLIKERDITKEVPSLTSFPNGYVKGLSSNNILILDGKAIFEDKDLVINEHL